jgi:lysophospholipase L1-like esterase
MRAGSAARRAVVLIPWIASGCGGGDAASPTGVPDSKADVLDGGMGSDAATEGPGDDGGSSADAAAPTSPDASPGDADAGAPVLATVHFLGRFDTRDAAGPRFAWPGSAIAATFQGTGITVSLTDTGTNDFAVVVDGAAPVKLATAGKSKSYSLASNLAAGQHTVVLTKRTESSVGVVQYLGFTVTGGALVASPYPFARRIEYVGDSITCGFGNLGVGPNCSFSDDTEDETLAYGALTAAELGAQQTVIAYSGKGMYRDNAGNTSNEMPVLFGLTLADDATSTWAFQTPAPDVVVINLSTNDFATGDPGSAFEQAYEAFLHQLRAKYPSAYVICTASPMMSGTSLASAVSDIETAVHALNASGDARVTMLQLLGDGGAPLDGGGAVGFATQQASDGYGCDYHPTTKTDAIMATALEPEIQRLTGW